MIRLLIVADDFTGGLDTGVQFASKGIRTRVITDPSTDFEQAAGECEVLVVVAETRHLSPKAAYDAVFDVVSRSARTGVSYIYKKTDSALRGNIGAELSAALAASGARRLPFLPAMPALRRCTIDGIHMIDGVPVNQSVFGADPFEPVRESSVEHLIALQSDVPTWHGKGSIPEGIEGICVLDAATDADLEATGSHLAADGDLRVMAGCAGFAGVLPELLGLRIGQKPELPRMGDGLFVLCGSVNPITTRQLDLAEQSGFRRIHISPEQKLTEGFFETAEGHRTLEDWCQATGQEKWLILDANDEDGTNAASAQFAAGRGMDIEAVRARISAALGSILPAIVGCSVPRTLLITGGDTLLQCMNHMNIRQVDPLMQVFPGVVLSLVDFGGQVRPVITKSGGFGEETLLLRLRELLESQEQA